ncbi:MAG TPA: tRNA (adenine-N1)-methyltransferase [Candidatus Thermoplasmatota archaeon]|nr:tRNA (adenine-N1)-methyltransferase [Candidatus Thermoplasmatota archaeon]
MIAAGEPVILLGADGERWLARAGAGIARERGLGVLDTGQLVGRAWGSRLEQAGKLLTLLPPSTPDLLATLKRKAQIILPKDAARILLECDVRAGSIVVEAGAGSGALTIALARAVQPKGRVVTYELREDFAAWARDNLEAADLLPWVELKVGDVRGGIAERGVDAVILDIPDPWLAVPAAWDALRPGGMLCGYSPLVSQVEQTHQALAKQGFRDLRTLELLERAWVVGERGARPSFDMLGHTGYLTFARRA